MTNKTTGMTEQLYQYMLSVSLRETEILRRLREETLAIRKLNQKLHSDERVTLSMVPISDGLTLALKRAH